jgi:hypothetical protein
VKKRLLAVAVLVLVAGGLYWFQPWRLVTSTTVDEALTPVAAPVSSAPVSSAPSSSSSPSPSPAGPVVVSEGDFVTHEHTTKGTARLVRKPDGRHQIEFAGLDTSDGPDLRVWLTDQKVGTGQSAWQVFDDGKYVELGKLKGNRGDQVYTVPADVDVEKFRSVSIWCKRFSVSFGAAGLS